MSKLPADGAALRQHFVDYFVGLGHLTVPSAPLVTRGDPSLMFVNAGMVPFKDIFSGQQRSPMRRAVSVQKCMRVSGKHNDLEEVGRTARHHTFFEMLGNFSFGDYFKEAAIDYAWNFIRRELQLDPKRLWVTVFAGDAQTPPDDEARALWRKISGLPDARILGMGAADNFWQMGERGPCGPCSEIHYDQGEGPVGAADFASGRVMEIWNNVFMQFDRQADGALQPLPAPCVDTGMGLERVAALLAGVDSNYHSDLFLPLLDRISGASHKPYGRSTAADDVSMRVVADHARSTAFLVADGVQPSNDGPGYVLRRLMRRAIRHGRRLGAADDLLAQACETVVEQFCGAYPELQAAQARIAHIAAGEAEAFNRTLDHGLKVFADAAASLRAAGERRLSGETLFCLYDTYGFPVDLSAVLAEEQGLTLDQAGFDAAMAAQQARSRGSNVGEAAVGNHYKGWLASLGPSRFIGGDAEDVPPAERQGLWRLGELDGNALLEAQVQIVALGQSERDLTQLVHPGGDAPPLRCEVVLQPTPFYGEAGGQAGDTGLLQLAEGGLARVVDSRRPLAELSVATVELLSGTLAVGAQVWAGYGIRRRQQIRAHHSATHLLQGALRAVLGAHVGQAGSFVGPDRLRFDFTHPRGLSPAERTAVEAHLTERIDRDALAEIFEVSQAQARAMGAIAMFGEKYGERVRVLRLADSIELCGGTHVAATGDIDLFLLLSEGAVKSGVRRVEAVVGDAARRRVRQLATLLQRAHCIVLGLPPPAADDDAPVAADEQAALDWLARLAPPKAAAATPATAAPAALLPATFGADLGHRLRDVWGAVLALSQAKENDQATCVEPYADWPEAAVLQAILAASATRRARQQGAEAHSQQQLAALATALLSQAEQVGEVPLLCALIADRPAADLRPLSDELRQRLGDGVIALAAVQGGKVTLLVCVAAALTDRLQAGSLIRAAAQIVGGRGGGKAEFAQAGGTLPERVPQALAQIRQQLQKVLNP